MFRSKGWLPKWIVANNFIYIIIIWNNLRQFTWVSISDVLQYIFLNQGRETVKAFRSPCLKPNTERQDTYRLKAHSFLHWFLNKAFGNWKRFSSYWKFSVLIKNQLFWNFSIRFNIDSTRSNIFYHLILWATQFATTIHNLTLSFLPNFKYVKILFSRG